MKKQIFILLMVVATFVMTKTYGQLAPRTVTCLTADALHPISGSPYSYEIQVPTPTGTKAYTWFVTQDKNFIASGTLTANRETNDGSGTHLLTTGTGYNNTTTGTNTLSITWKSFIYDAANPVFVVIQATNNDGSCTTQNMKVFKIQPQNSFTLDIANLDTGGTPATAGALIAGYGANFDKCIHDIVAATYDATAPEGVIYDYGTDYMFFEVVAANFSTSWKPSFTLTGVDGNETVTVEWDETKDFASPHPLTLAAGIYSSADVYTAVAAGGAVGTAGESIYVRVTLDHSTTVNYQGLTAEAVALAVDGITNVGAPVAEQLGDIHTVAGGTPSGCPWIDGFLNDIATQTLKPRPDITATTMPAPGLLPVKP